MNKKGIAALGLSLMMAGTMLTGCGSGDSDGAGKKADAKGSVYYLNFKPEQDAQWQELAKVYTEETGVDVTVVTAASGQYETTLKSEMGKSESPTLFQVNGPVGLASWKDYCYDLGSSQVYKELTSEDFALKDGDKVAGIGYVIESYGIIYNKELLSKAGYTEDDINSFADLKKVAEDITANSDKLGFSAFTSAGMDGSSDWRFKTHLANLQSTMNTRLMESILQMRSRVHILIITKMYGICTSTTQQPIQSSSAQRLVMMRLQSLFQDRQYFIRMVHGHTQMYHHLAMTTSECSLSI